MTKLLYLDDSYIFESKATITGKMVDEKGPYILLDQTIFYPQGGGQPSDQGIIQGDGFQLEITFVRQFEDKICHYLNRDLDKNLDGQSVLCHINKDRRLLNARYHTAGHLLSYACA